MSAKIVRCPFSRAHQRAPLALPAFASWPRGRCHAGSPRGTATSASSAVGTATLEGCDSSIVGGATLEDGASAAATGKLTAEGAKHAVGGTGDEGRSIG